MTMITTKKQLEVLAAKITSGVKVPAKRGKRGVCGARGAPTGESVECPSCAGTVQLKLFSCDAGFGDCTLERSVPGKACCATCNGFRPPAVNGIVTYDENSLFPQLPGKRFNPAVIEYEGGYLFCWRDGWKGSNLWACRMGRDLAPRGEPIKIDVRHPNASYGREDPQFFLHHGSLHVAFVGVAGRGNHVTKTNVLYARLNPDLSVDAIHSPKAPGVDPRRWEKNWEFFSHGGELYAVYSISPHRVLRVRGGHAEWVHETVNPMRWEGGELRGGASPVLVGDEWWCFHHDRVDLAGKRLYRYSLYTFEDRAPFRVKRYVPRPLAEANPLTNPGNYCHCIFPRGAVRDGDDWVISCGAHDRFTEIHRLNHAEIESQLVPA